MTITVCALLIMRPTKQTKLLYLQTQMVFTSILLKSMKILVRCTGKRHLCITLRMKGWRRWNLLRQNLIFKIAGLSTNLGRALLKMVILTTMKRNKSMMKMPDNLC